MTSDDLIVAKYDHGQIAYPWWPSLRLSDGTDGVWFLGSHIGP